ncbi:MAG: phosphopyruvate hydratase [Patescibacteria group bacterium]
MRPTSIKQITAYEILDSRGNPTVRSVVILHDGSTGTASVPSGASTGAHEAVELRDSSVRYGGKGVLKAVKNVNTIIAKALNGADAALQRKVDEIMIALDGTKNKSKLGANAILSVSMAATRAAAVSKRRPLYQHIRQAFHLKEKGCRMPLPTMNIINGGRHADNHLTIQEFMIVPVNNKFAERVRIGSEVFHALGKILSEKGYSTGAGDEGGYAPEFSNNEQAIKFIMQAIKTAGYVPGKHVYLAMDIAASEFFSKGKYYFNSPKQPATAGYVIQKLESWVKKYPFVSIEDPLSEDDWANWKLATKVLGKKVAVVGDDIFVTNTERIGRAIKEKVGNAALIKLNQIGTLSETIDAIYLAKNNGYKVSISHRSGETADTFIADLSVAVNAEFIKTGSVSRSERVEKYNRLMEIEREIRN